MSPRLAPAILRALYLARLEMGPELFQLARIEWAFATWGGAL